MKKIKTFAVVVSGYPPLYQYQPLEPGIQTVVNSNKITFEPCGDLVDEVCFLYNTNIHDNKDSFDQTENVETGENAESNRNSAIPNFMPRIVADDETLVLFITGLKDILNTRVSMLR